jgi:radical SAM protein with 4Fe4S-binding SPASM domain
MKPLYYLLWNTSNNDEILTERALSLIDEFVQCGGFVLNIGGEPLLRKDIVKIINYATSNGIITTLRISGKYLTRSIAKKIKEVGIRAIILPIFSIDKEKNDYILGEGCYNDVIKSSKICSDIGINLETSAVITKENVNELNALIKLSVKLKSKLLIIQRPIIFKALGIEYEDFTSDEYKKLLFEIQDLSERMRDKLIITLTHCPFKILLPKKIEIEKKVDDVYGGCSAGFVSCAILSNGAVIPCLPLPVEAGNIKKETLINIWKNAHLFKKLRNRNNLKGKCGRCKHKRICGGCRAEAYYNYGDYLREDTKCWL